METVTSTAHTGRLAGGRRRVRGRRISSGIRGAVIACGAVGVLAGIIRAQQLLVPNARVARPQVPSARPADPFAAVIQPSEEATTLLRRAGEGIRREDWKLVIDSLQRIVELPGEHVLTSDEQLYESARRHAHRRIAALPAPGLEAYRLVHDGEAMALFKRGLEGHRADLLQVVVDRFLCTRAGESAALALADWLIDEGRFSEAAGLLQSAFGANGQGGIYPDSRLPAWVVPSRLAVCAAGMGQRQRAEALVDAAATRPAGDRGDEAAARLNAVRSFVTTQRAGISAQQSDAWICSMGGWARDGRQSEVTPTLTGEQDTPKVSLSEEPKLGLEAAADYARRYRLMPVGRVVTDGQVLVVRHADYLLGLDADSFSERWKSRKRHEEATPASPDEFSPVQQQRGMRPAEDSRSNQDAQMRTDPVVVRRLYDSVGGALSLAQGMALAVEWVGDPPQPLPENMSRRLSGFPGRDPFAAIHPNRIVAYSLTDGSFLWKSDASATRQINLTGPGPAETEFLAPPVPAEGHLVAPCRMNSDLFAVLLDPRTGRLARQIYLCGAGGGAFDSLCALEPCLVDGVLFFPTGRELLVAVETASWSVRWAARYPALKDGQSAKGWLPGPPVAVGDVILLAPSDSDALLCFDRASGSLRWRAPRGEFTHIIAAGDKGVWVGGRNAALIDLESGRTVWHQETAEMSGRGCLSGERLYLPTFEGLRALNAADGREIRMDLPVEPQVLGNLLAWQGSLYSAGMIDLKKYPDLGKGYEQAVARYQENPADPSRALRLASIELLRNEPMRAIAALASIPADLQRTNPPQHQSVIHLRVRAMLESVASGQARDEAALKLLTEARAIALTSEDALESVRELGEHLLRSNQPLEAAMQYLTLVLSADGNQFLAAENGVQRQARGRAIERIVAALGRVTPAQAERFNQRVEAFLAEAEGSRSAESLLWLAESPELGEPAHRAEILLGRWAAAELRHEQAESFFLRALRGSREPKTLAEASARLAALYLEPDDLHQPVSALRWLERLRREWGEVPLDRSVLDPAGDAAGSTAWARDQAAPLPAPAAAPLPAREAADLLSQRLDRTILKAHQAALAPVLLGKPGPPTLRMHPMARPMSFRTDRGEPLADRMMLFIEGNKVEAHTLEDGSVLWPAELKLLGDVAVEQRPPDWNQNIASQRTDSLGPARGVLSGQTMIVNTEYGVHAIGLLTGRRLWSRRFTPPEGPGDQAASDACIWAHDGYVVVVDADRRLEAAHAGQGDRILWRASMPNRKWAAIRARGPYVVAVNAALETADVLRLADGRYVGECTFRQDVSPSRLVNITLFDDVICGPASARIVKALDLAAPGVERWRTETPAPLVQIFKPTPDLLAVSDASGLLRLIDPANGKTLMETRVKSCGQGIIDGAIVDGMLYVYGYQERATDAAEVDRQQQYALAAVNVANGNVLWELRDLHYRTFLNDEVLRASPNAIPVASFVPPGGRRGREGPGANARADGGTPSGVVELQVIDKKTGKPIGEKITTVLDKDTGASRIQTVEVWPGRIFVVTGSTHLRYPVEPPMTGTGGGASDAQPAGRSRGGDSSRGQRDDAEDRAQGTASDDAETPARNAARPGVDGVVPARVMARVTARHAAELQQINDPQRLLDLIEVWVAEELGREERRRIRRSEQRERRGGLR